MSVHWYTKREKVNAQLAEDIDDVLGSSPFTWAVYRGWASSEQQAELYKKHLAGGSLAAPPFHSAHEANGANGEPSALAVDIVRINENGKDVWDYEKHPAWPWLWHAIKIHPRLHSGHEFPFETEGRVPADDDHIQLQRVWLKYKASLKIEGKW